MKKLLVLLLIGILVFGLGLAGCTPKVETPAEEPAEAPAEEAPIIGFSNASVSNTWRVAMWDMMKAQLDADKAAGVLKTIKQFKKNNFAVKLGSLLQVEEREYYRQNHFKYLEHYLATI